MRLFKQKIEDKLVKVSNHTDYKDIDAMWRTFKGTVIEVKVEQQRIKDKKNRKICVPLSKN